MVTIITKQGETARIGSEIHTVQEVYCKSTDKKPIKGMRNADPLMEMDTKNIFMFDEEVKDWILISEGGK